MIGRRRIHSMLCILSSAALLAGVLGCGSRPAVTLYQPFAAPAQRHLTLHSERSVCAAENGRHISLLRFPLPGAVDGPEAYVIYVAAPARPGRHRVDSSGPEAAHGFLIQHTGPLAGRSDLVAGTIRYRNCGDGKQVELDVICADRTHIRGTVRTRSDRRAVDGFQRAHAADIARLTPRHGAAAPRPHYSRD